jgi:hypothetical protein
LSFQIIRRKGDQMQQRACQGRVKNFGRSEESQN